MKNKKAGKLTLPDIKTFYKTTAIKKSAVLRNNKQTNEIKQSVETDSHVQIGQRSRTDQKQTFTLTHFIYDRGDNTKQQKKNGLSVNGAGSTGYPYGKK